MSWTQLTHRPAARGVRRLQLVRTYWRMRGRSGRVLLCGLYLTDAGHEMRVGYGDDDPLRIQVVPDDRYADTVAAGWKVLVEAKGSFVDLGPTLP
jgi:hypothetical protein